MKDLNELLIELSKYLEDNDAAILKSLQKGLNQDYTTATLANIGISNNELPVLYEWKNGIDINAEFIIGAMDFFSHGVFLSLENAIENRESLLESECITSEFLLPIFTNGGGDYILFNAVSNSQSTGQLLSYSPMVTLSLEPITIYDSLANFVETIIECYKKKAYVFNDGILEVDYELEKRIASILNPNAAYWQE